MAKQKTKKELIEEQVRLTGLVNDRYTTICKREAELREVKRECSELNVAKGNVESHLKRETEENNALRNFIKLFNVILTGKSQDTSKVEVIKDMIINWEKEEEKMNRQGGYL